MAQRADYRKAAAGGYEHLIKCWEYIRNSGLNMELIDLVFYRCSQINGCAFCMDMHHRDLVKAGVPVDKLAIVSSWRSARELFTADEQAALIWAERVTNIAGAPITDEEFESARKTFSEKELSDLTLAVGLINAFNRLGIAFDIEPAAVRIHAREHAAKN